MSLGPASGGPWGRWGCLYVGKGGIGVGALVEFLGLPVDTVSLPVTTGASFTRIWFRAA